MTDDCPHTHLTLIPPEVQVRLRCRRCHLTLPEDELSGGACPECLERDGRRRKDFERVEIQTAKTTRMRCETCGMVADLG